MIGDEPCPCQSAGPSPTAVTPDVGRTSGGDCKGPDAIPVCSLCERSFHFYMPPQGFKCKQCGNCCLNLSGAIDVCVSEEDIQLWRDNFRLDILEWVDAIHVGEGQYVYDIWINPETGEDAARCPWLRKLPKQDKYICRINDMKPEHCRNYPLSREHAKRTGCKGFDP